MTYVDPMHGEMTALLTAHLLVQTLEPQGTAGGWAGCKMDMQDVAQGVAARQGGLPVLDLDLTHFSSLGPQDIRDLCGCFAHLQ